MITTDFNKEPWKHPAVWKSHVVTMTLQYLCNVQTRRATCECGWAACVRFDRGPRGLDAAINAHWHEVITEAKSEAA